MDHAAMTGFLYAIRLSIGAACVMFALYCYHKIRLYGSV